MSADGIDPATIRDVLGTLVGGRALSPLQASAFFDELLGGRLEPSQIGAALAMIQQRGPSVEELVAGARAMRAHVTPVPVEAAWEGTLIDTCGTGGAPKTFNVSTIAAKAARPAPASFGSLPAYSSASHFARVRTGVCKK